MGKVKKTKLFLVTTLSVYKHMKICMFVGIINKTMHRKRFCVCLPNQKTQHLKVKEHFSCFMGKVKKMEKERKK